MVKKKKVVVKGIKKDHTISLVILGVVAVLAIVGLVLLFSTAQNSGMVQVNTIPGYADATPANKYYVETYSGPKVYGGASQGEGSFRQANVRGTPAWVLKEGSATEYEIALRPTATAYGIQDKAYGSVHDWDAYQRNYGAIKKCADYPNAVLYNWPLRDYYKNNPNWECEGTLVEFKLYDSTKSSEGYKTGVCCQIKGNTMTAI